MENILKKIAEFDKVNETKLAKHEINLALVDELKNEADKLQQFGSAFLKQRLVIYAEMKTAKAQLETYFNQSKKVVSLYDNVKKKYNELGLDYEKDASLNKTVMAIQEIDEYEKFYQQVKSFNLVGI